MKRNVNGTRIGTIFAALMAAISLCAVAGCEQGNATHESVTNLTGPYYFGHMEFDVPPAGQKTTGTFIRAGFRQDVATMTTETYSFTVENNHGHVTFYGLPDDPVSGVQQFTPDGGLTASRTVGEIDSLKWESGSEQEFWQTLDACQKKHPLPPGGDGFSCN